MRMIQTLYPCDTSWTEIFYDGQVSVVNNVVEFDGVRKAHWIDQLRLLGFEPLEEEASQEAVDDQLPVTKTGRKKVNRGEDNK